MKLYLLLLFFAIAGLSPAHSQASAVACSSLFLDLPYKAQKTYPPMHLKMFYKSVGSWDRAIPYHLDNVDVLFTALKNKKITAALTGFEKGQDGGLQQFILKDFDASFIVVNSNTKPGESTTYFTLKDSTGRWFYVQAQKKWGSDKYVLDFATLQFVPSEVHRLNNYKPALSKVFQEHRISDMNSTQLSDYLSSLQLKTSTNAKNASPEQRQVFIKGIQDAYQMLAELLVHGRTLEVAHLEKLNLFANAGINPYEWKINEPMAGVLRGTKDKIVLIQGKPTAIDMSAFEVAQTWKTTALGVPYRLNYFVPAKEVPARVETLLQRIAKIDHNSSPLDVFQLYRDFVVTHPFADGNGRTARMLLNYLLVKAGMPPSETPAASLFYRPEDALRKYLQKWNLHSVTAELKAKTQDLSKLESFKDINDLAHFSTEVKNHFGLEHVKIKHLHGTLAYIFVGTYKGRFIQFESIHKGALSAPLGELISKSQKIIDHQESNARKLGKNPPSYAIYPELLAQADNYHQSYQFSYLIKKFKAQQGRIPNETEKHQLEQQAAANAERILHEAEQLTNEREYLTKMMETPRLDQPAQTAEDVAAQIMEITSPTYRAKIHSAMVEKASAETKNSFVEIYNAFNSARYDKFMIEVVEKALSLCRKAGDCHPRQKNQIPEKYLAQVIKLEGDRLGVLTETISRFVGREPGKLFLERIRRGSLIIDDGAPGNHGLMPHALQNLFIYQELGLIRGKQFFKEITGWTYERMFDSNEAFTPIPGTRDLTRRHYWTGIFVAGNRAESSKWGTLDFEKGRYPEFLRNNELDLVEVKEIEKNLVNDGGLIRARFQGTEFEFTIDGNGVPGPDALEAVLKLKGSAVPVSNL